MQKRFNKSFALLSLILFGLSCHEAEAGQGGFRVSSYVGVGPHANLIHIDGGRSEGVATGDVFRIFRVDQQSVRENGLSIETGAAKAVAVYEHKTIAEVIQQSTPLSQKYFPAFPEVMAGDIATPQRLEIRRNVAITPERSLLYHQLFEDPKAVPQSFELSSTGKEELSEAAREFAGLRSTSLMIIGHTDATGPADSNQIESYQRAMVVRQYLIDHLGFDASRLTAIGKGEDDLPEGELTPGYADRARRIVLKVVPLP